MDIFDSNPKLHILFQIDLSQFYEGIQKNSKDKEIQKNYEKAKNEIQLLNLQLKQKRHIESKLKNEIEELKLKNQHFFKFE